GGFAVVDVGDDRDVANGAVHGRCDLAAGGAGSGWGVGKRLRRVADLGGGWVAMELRGKWLFLFGFVAGGSVRVEGREAWLGRGGEEAGADECGSGRR